MICKDIESKGYSDPALGLFIYMHITIVFQVSGKRL